MLIKSRQNNQLTENHVTDQGIYRQRRSFITSAAALAGMAAVPQLWLPGNAVAGARLAFKKTGYGQGLKPTSRKHITTYNNFYEFGTSKSAPAANAKSLKPRPWSVAVDGEVEKPGTYALEDILKNQSLEERIYRLRCVEGWSMVIPWVGFPLVDLIKRLKPTSKAKFVEFQTLHDPEQMPGQRRTVLAWPYTEGLRIDEAVHPLTLLAVGLYGEVLPNQNGAPLRLVVPWKYGFKNIKSIVRIRFVEKQPRSSWQAAAPHEYGFYANVNPQVDHPRWSQKTERVIGSFGRRKTELFNGFAEQVAGLYRGMDLKKNY